MLQKKRTPKLRLVDKPMTQHAKSADMTIIEGPAVKVMDELCRLVSHLAGASMVMLASKAGDEKAMKVIGRSGTLVTEVDMQRILTQLNPHSAPTLLSPDVKTDLRLQSDPLLELMPHVKSLIAMLVPASDMSAPTVLYVGNPRKSAIQDGATMQMLSDVAGIVRDLLALKRSHAGELAELKRELLEAAGAGETGQSRFSEADDRAASQADRRAAATFLFETLVRRRGLHSRKGADYVSLRTWRLPVKKYQVSALVAIKDSPSNDFVLRVADELAAYVRQAHGESVIRTVVPVPPGSSAKPESLSTMVAEAVARLLGANYLNVLEPVAPVAPGKSTPRKSAQLQGYRLQRHLEGPVLIIDDVASSGRHIELAINACKSPATAVYALVWVGK